MIITVQKSRMDGSIRVSGAKNAALPILIASLLIDNVTLSNIPLDLIDVSKTIALLQCLGCKVDAGNSADHNRDSFVKIDNSNLAWRDLDSTDASTIRASLWILVPALMRFGQVILPLPGGCSLNNGPRMIDFHLEIIKKMGAEIEFIDNGVKATLKDIGNGFDLIYPKISVGATIAGVMAGAISKTTTNLYNCATEPEVVDVCNFLVKAGANIQGMGTRVLTIEPISQFKEDVSYRIISDRLEAYTYILAAGASKGRVGLTNIEHSLISIMQPYFTRLGIAIESNGLEVSEGDAKSEIYASSDQRLQCFDVSTSPYPGFPTDLQAPFMSAMTTASGRGLVEENLFDNRFAHVAQLKKMGANIEVLSHRMAILEGVRSLTGTEVYAHNLRSGSALVIAGMMADGVTTIHNAEQIFRGYENIHKKLAACGVNIELLS